MKIEKIYIKNIGPFDEKEIDFRDEWTGEISSRVLFSGPNGCGKTTVLNCISYLWQALGYWLYERKGLPKNHFTKKFLGTAGNCALLINGIPYFPGKDSHMTEKVLIFIGDKYFASQLIRENNKEVHYSIGEVCLNEGKGIYRFGMIPQIISQDGEPFPHDQEIPLEQLFLEKIEKDSFFSDWSAEHKRLILSGSKTSTPNIIYLDAEERRWLKAEKKIGKPVQEDMGKRWLYKYQASKNWDSQLEASLITLKTTSLHKFHEVVRLMNTFFVDKEIVPDIHPGENRLRINIKNKRNTWHTFEELSAGEREMLVLVYSISRWMENGGVVMVDEPDLFLHPCIMADAFSAIEKLVEEKQGQLIVTSHFPEMWERYENRAKRIKLAKGDVDE
jgi:energy-coupling factor transporter ATP-binding protein EcfA2